jgi:lipid II:glycine glycyltransferase (peptidoglycan interpeptide bridge formation enzyme)
MKASVVGRPSSVVASFRTLTDPAAWDGLVAGLPRAHLLQSWAWGEFKVRNGWRPARLVWKTPAGEAAAQVLARTALRLARVLYVPRGPLVAWEHAAASGQVLDALQGLARRQRAILIKIDPDVAVTSGSPGQEQPCEVGLALQAELRRRGWVPSAGQVQFRNTITLDLRRSEADLLAAMKPKTRYNLRLAERRGVAVRPGAAADLDLLYRLYAETSLRDGFVIRNRDYYQEAWGRFMRCALGWRSPSLPRWRARPSPRWWSTASRGRPTTCTA